MNHQSFACIARLDMYVSYQDLKVVQGCLVIGMGGHPIFYYWDYSPVYL